MIVLIDTTIWSLALRRRPESLNPNERQLVEAWAALVRSGGAAVIGPIRQEVLAGIREQAVFAAIQKSLADFTDLAILPHDYDQAAAFFNRCRANGISGTPIDLLICTVAKRLALPIFTTDLDFDRYARLIGLRLFRAGQQTSPIP